MSLARLSSLSIPARSFLLVLAALIVAEGIGLSLFLTRPPLRNAPVAVNEVAGYLREDAGPEAQQGPGPRPEQRPFDEGPGRGAPPGPPPADYGMDRGPQRMPPPPNGHVPGSNLTVEDLPSPPVTISNRDSPSSAAVSYTLARLLRVDRSELSVQLPKERAPPSGRREEERRLGQGFVIARHLADGRWRTVTSVIEGFPNAFQRQALTLFGVGLALLLPLAWLFSRALSAPIQRFAEGAQRLGQDPIAAPLPSEGPTEIRAAVDAFNLMQARIQRLLQERTQMIAAIAHDLRTPLTRLAFRLEGLPAPLSEKVGADIQEMKEMISAALDFIRDRATAGTRERLELRALIERIVDEQTDLGHDVSFAAGVPTIIEGVPLALRRMLANLVENALKYGQRARLRLSTGEAQAIIEIDDDGPGIPENRQQQVFEPFFRLEASRNRDTGGIGLGLATVRAIVLDHGGEIALGNRSGGGLKVTLRLPLPA